MNHPAVAFLESKGMLSLFTQDVTIFGISTLFLGKAVV